MKMSADGRARMRFAEKVVLRYYKDMGKNRGNCTWGAGILAHQGVRTQEALLRLERRILRCSPREALAFASGDPQRKSPVSK
jgi:hypothetical protein